MKTKTFRSSFAVLIACLLLALPAYAIQSVTITNIGVFPGYDRSEAVAINGLGQVAGNNFGPNGYSGAFFWSNSDGMIDLGTLGGIASEAAAINDSGQVVGWSTDSSGRGLVG